MYRSDEINSQPRRDNIKRLADLCHGVMNSMSDMNIGGSEYPGYTVILDESPFRITLHEPQLVLSISILRAGQQNWRQIICYSKRDGLFLFDAYRQADREKVITALIAGLK